MVQNELIKEDIALPEENEEEETEEDLPLLEPEEIKTFNSLISDGRDRTERN